MIQASYVLPLRTAHPQPELAPYLHRLALAVDQVVVVEGSAADVVAAHAAAWPADVLHIGVDPDLRCPNGKVGGVLTGLRRVRNEAVIIADDDVRYDVVGMQQVVALLASADLVVPQNHFVAHPGRRLPWHAAWDTARSLLNRALVHDFPGTVAVRHSVLAATGGYAGDVLFENLQLIRTVRAAGGRVVQAPWIYVPRLPPTTAHFLGQRVRQAYDSFAQPARMAAELALLPAGLALARRRGRAGIAAAAVLAIGLAEFGRRRWAGSCRFPLAGSVLAPAWLAERAVCSWLAVAVRLTGGAPYPSLGRLPRAASSERALRAALRPQRRSSHRPMVAASQG